MFYRLGIYLVLLLYALRQAISCEYGLFSHPRIIKWLIYRVSGSVTYRSTQVSQYSPRGVLHSTY